MALQDLEQVAEEVDVDEVSEASKAFQCGREKRAAVVELDDAEIESEEELECLGLVALPLLLIKLALGFANLLVDRLLLLLGLTSLLRTLLRHSLLCLATLPAAVVLLLVPSNNAVLALPLTEDGVGGSTNSPTAKLVLEPEVEQAGDNLRTDGKGSSANEASNEADEVERVRGFRGRVVLEKVHHGIEALLMTFVPTLASESLHDGVHDVDREVEVGLLADEGAETVECGGSDRRVLCKRA